MREIHDRDRREFIAILSTNERGPVERRKAGTRSQAFAAARTLLTSPSAAIGIGARSSACRSRRATTELVAWRGARFSHCSHGEFTQREGVAPAPDAGAL